MENRVLDLYQVSLDKHGFNHIISIKIVINIMEKIMLICMCLGRDT
jgi:hypothetical protein